MTATGKTARPSLTGQELTPIAARSGYISGDDFQAALRLDPMSENRQACLRLTGPKGMTRQRAMAR
jgi:hypothetical protein